MDRSTDKGYMLAIAVVTQRPRIAVLLKELSNKLLSSKELLAWIFSGSYDQVAKIAIESIFLEVLDMTDVVELTQEEIQVVHGGTLAEDWQARRELMDALFALMSGIATDRQRMLAAASSGRNW